METVVLLIVVAAVAFGVMKYRSDASRERKEVLARIQSEQETRGDFSPTVELFREAGAPIGAMAAMTTAAERPAAVALPDHGSEASQPSPASPASTATSLAAMFQGIQMPMGLAPLGEMTPSAVTFTTPALPRDVQPALAAEFERIGAEAVWPEATVAQVRRAGGSATLTIYPRPDLAVDLDGQRLFPTAAPDSCVVRLTLI